MSRALAAPAVVLIALLAACAAPRPPVPGSAADGWRIERVVEPSPFRGVHGLGFDPQDRLVAGSVVGQSLYAVDRDTGAVTTLVGPPQGMADDVAFAPDGTMAWTGFLSGDLYARKGDGPIRKLASGLPGINSLAYRADGRLFATQVFLGDALYEIDPAGAKPPRKVMEGMGGLNGFQFGRDGRLYGPLWFKGQVVAVDVDAARLEVIADGFKVPAAVNIDSQGRIFVVDTKAGQLVRIDPATRAKTVVAQLSSSLDNLAIDSKDRIFVSNMADAGIQEVDAPSGRVRQVTRGRLAAPGGVAIAGHEVYVADLFAFRRVDAATGRVTDLARMHGDELEYPFSVTANARSVVLSSWFTSSVQVFDRASGKPTLMVHGLAAPHDAVQLADGSLMVAELGTGKLLHVSGPEGKTRRALADGLAAPIGLAHDSRDWYVTEFGSGAVTRIDGRTGEKRVVAGGLQGPEGIARRDDGTLVVVEAGAKRIVEVDPATGIVTPIATSLPIGSTGPAGVPPSYIPTGVAIGADGSVWFASDVDNGLYRLVKR
jgi:sugar lactone lactonase YvrE